MNIVVKKDKRNLGIGSKLLEEIIKKAIEINSKTITLEVNENNLPAIKLYEKYGFKQIGLRKKYYNNIDNAIIMTTSVCQFGDVPFTDKTVTLGTDLKDYTN